MTNTYKVDERTGDIEKLTTREVKQIAGGARTLSEAKDIICNGGDYEFEFICFGYDEAKDLSRHIKERLDK